ncbi:MAG: glycosyltransferase [Acidimicrobiales bacterium]
MPSATTPEPRPRPLVPRLAPWLPAAAWAYLALGRGGYWSTATRLPPDAHALPENWPPVAVVVPARDEADVLPRALPSLLTQDYPGHAWVVLVDDQSSDGTAPLARALAKKTKGRGLGLSIVEGKPRPPGWAGKPWAMAQGVEHALAGPDKPQWFLFTDADIRHPPGSVRQLLAAALGAGRDCVSLMACLSTATAWERLLMPAFVYFFAQIYPFGWVNDRDRRTAAAAGGCMLVNAAALQHAGGIDAIANSTIDDVALAKALKGAGSAIWLGLAGEGGEGDAPRLESLRSYPRLADMWEMVARSAYTQLGYSPAALAGTVAALSSIYLAPPLLAWRGFARGRPAVATAGLSAWTAMAATYLPMARYYRVSPASATALPFTASLYMAMTLDSARRHRAGAVAWKGRRLGQSGTGPGRRRATLDGW